MNDHYFYINSINENIFNSTFTPNLILFFFFGGNLEKFIY